MPVTKKGKKIMSSFRKRYGKKKGEAIAYATANKKGGKLYKALHSRSKKRGRKKKK